MAKASKSSASEHVEGEGFEGYYAELGGTTVGWETYTADADMTPLFVGLPDDRCQCEHWATCSRARSCSTRPTGTRSSSAGTPTSSARAHAEHLRRHLAGRVGPSDRLNQTMEVVTKNMEAAEGVCPAT